MYLNKILIYLSQKGTMRKHTNFFFTSSSNKQTRRFKTVNDF